MFLTTHILIVYDMNRTGQVGKNDLQMINIIFVRLGTLLSLKPYLKPVQHLTAHETTLRKNIFFCD